MCRRKNTAEAALRGAAPAKGEKIWKKTGREVLKNGCLFVSVSFLPSYAGCFSGFAVFPRYPPSLKARESQYTTHWELVDLYADAGISGTSAEKRPDFQRLLSDCRKGRIDKVLVKSISRFARNTMDLCRLSLCPALRQHGFFNLYLKRSTV